MIIVEWFYLSLLLSIVFTRLLFVERVVFYNQILVIIIVLLCHSGSLGRDFFLWIWGCPRKFLSSLFYLPMIGKL